MPVTHCLLMEIELPDSEQPLCLMSGNGFEVLYTDTTGRDVYGLAHAGRDYLFFPFSFKPVDAGVLSVHLPAEYEESCLDSAADGARIIFSSPHGSPFFADMPEEFQSGSGIVRISEAGEIRVFLDKAEASRALCQQAGCGCGHEHGPFAGTRNHDAGLDDKRLARLLREKIADVNVLLGKASGAGLLVEMEIGGEHGRPEVRLSQIVRPL